MDRKDQIVRILDVRRRQRRKEEKEEGCFHSLSLFSSFLTHLKSFFPKFLLLRVSNSISTKTSQTLNPQFQFSGYKILRRVRVVSGPESKTQNLFLQTHLQVSYQHVSHGTLHKGIFHIFCFGFSSVLPHILDAEDRVSWLYILPSGIR